MSWTYVGLSLEEHDNSVKEQPEEKTINGDTSDNVTATYVPAKGDDQHLFHNFLFSCLAVFTARRYNSVEYAVCLFVHASVTSRISTKTAKREIRETYERAILLVKCDFAYSCAAADKISTDLRRRAVPLR